MCNSNFYMLLLFTVLMLGAWIAVSGCEIRPLDPVTGKAILEEHQQAFDAASFVEESWALRVMPAIERDAVDLSQLLSELQADQASASAEYGHQEGGNAFSFIVQGAGQVSQVDTVSRAGVLHLDIPGQTAEVRLQIGPVLRGTALRDVLPFITFDQFVNQLEYARVSQALHDRLIESVLSQVDFQDMQGQEISFKGVFTLQDPATILITPVQIESGQGK